MVHIKSFLYLHGHRRTISRMVHIKSFRYARLVNCQCMDFHKKHRDVARLQTRPRAGRPQRISRETMMKIKTARKAVYLTAEGLRDLIRDGTGRVRDGVCDSLRACAVAELGIHQKSPGGKACKEGRQAEDRMVWEKAATADRGEEARRLHHLRAGRDDRYG